MKEALIYKQVIIKFPDKNSKNIRTYFKKINRIDDAK